MSRRLAALLALALGLAGACPTPAPAAQQATGPRLTFTPQPIAFPAVVSAVSFTDATRGHVVGAYHSVFATTDGGATWVRQSTPLPTADPTTSDHLQPEDPRNQGFTGVSFADAEHGHAVTNDDAVVATADGGNTWTVQPTPRPGAVGAQYSGGVVPLHWNFTGVAFPDPDHGYVVGGEGVILATGDGGTSWTYQGDPKYGNLTGLAFADSSHGEVVGDTTGRPNEIVYTTIATDDGENWQVTSAGPKDAPVAPVDLTAVATAVPLHAVAVGDGGRIFVTFDGGKTWRNRRNGTNETLNGVAFFDRRRGLAVGTVNFQGDLRAQILATVDGGETWTAYPSPEYADFEGVDFADASTAYAVGCAIRVKSDEFLPTCRQAAVVKIDFPEVDLGTDDTGSSAGSPVPVILLALAVAIAGGGFLVARRR